MRRHLAFVLTAIVATLAAHAADDDSARSNGSALRYTFSWPIAGDDALKPRGGTTQGPPVTLDGGESAAWKALQEPNISAFERDRRAILAMAGDYRVTFDFLEIAQYAGEDEPVAPYQSWGTEKIYVDEDEGKFISLVHILEMRVIQQDGSVSEPIVTKHWRQDWRYEPTYIIEYQGHDRWTRRKLGPQEARGAWLQSVYQVDESPRYASTGRWEHTSSFSSWLSDDTRRPLPRREWSVRDDYHALIGANRHTVDATGWLQEENNLKAVLTRDRTLDPSRPYLAREYGVARYERIRDQDFAAADRYYSRTKQFWDHVRDRWSQLFASRGSVTLRGPVDKLGLFMPLFQHADAIAVQGPALNEKNEAMIEDALRQMGALQK